MNEDSVSIDIAEVYTPPLSTSKLNYSEMYIRSNSPIGSNFNSDVEIEKESNINWNQDSSIEDELSDSSQPLKSRSIHRNFKDFTKKFNLVKNEYYNDDFSKDESKSQNTIVEFIGFTDFEEGSKSEVFGRCDVSNENGKCKKYKKCKKLTYKEIEDSLSKYYDKNDTNFTEIDILITYLNGVRIMYTLSRNITHLKSCSIFTSTILLTLFLTIVAPFIKDLYWGFYLISAGNGVATILLTVSRLLKLDPNAAQYNLIAKQFSKLLMQLEYENSLEMPSSQKINDIEQKMLEFNEYIQELVPQQAIQLFPLIYRTNIIHFIKKQALYKKKLIARFCDIKNEIIYILYRLSLDGENLHDDSHKNTTKTPKHEREKTRLLYLMDLKEKTKKELMDCKKTYIQLNELFKNEIRYAETPRSCFGCLGVFKPDYNNTDHTSVIRDYLKLTMPE